MVCSKHSPISTLAMATCYATSTKFVLLIALLLFSDIIAKRESVDGASTDQPGKRWAILVAGSNGYENYRHQVIQ